MLNSAREGVVAAVTRVEKYIRGLTAEEKNSMGFKGTLETQLNLVASMEDSFCSIQEQIVNSQTSDAAKKVQVAYGESFKKRCAVLASNIKDIMKSLPAEAKFDANLPTGILNFMTSFLSQSEQRHQQQMDLLLSTLTGTASTAHPLPPNPTSPPGTRPVVNKLPDIVLPRFDGKFSSWMSFKDRFTASVINYPGIAEVTCLGYLQSALSGDAKSAVMHIETVEGNFKVAWKILTDKFERKNDIVSDHIKTFYAMPRMSGSNPNAINEITNIFAETTMALDAMKVTQRDPWLIQYALDRLDSESRVLWGREIGSDVPTLDQFSKFLNQRCVDQRNSTPITAKPTSSTANPTRSNKSTPTRKSANALATSASSNACRFCQESAHPLYKCSKFLGLPAGEKFLAVQKLSLCRNCFATHLTSSCTYHKCQKCHARHNILLHDHFAATDAPAVPDPNNGTPKNKSTNSDSAVLTVHSSQNHPLVNRSSVPRVFLATALVNVFTANGESIKCRLVLDGAAQVNVMTSELYSRLNLPKFPANFTISGINASRSRSRFCVQATVQSRTSDTAYTFKCFVLPNIAGNIPNWKVDTSAIPMPQHIPLADPSWHVQQPVDLLLCGNPYWASWLTETIRLGDGLPLLKETVFGFVVVGEHEPVPPPEDVCCLSTTALNETLRRFWEIEDLPTDEKVTDSHIAAEHHFATTHTRNSEGRFVVQLPFREDPKLLGDSRSLAVRQFLSLERRFAKNPALRTLYCGVMDEQLKQGWVEPVPAGSSPSSAFYMPHHGVLKNSTTTKLRIVFNASAKSSSGHSLNDLLRIGPTVQPTLAETLLRFRRHHFALTADITKMYLQVVLDPSHADFQRFVWRPDKSQPIQDYRVPRVCFGVASSPFLATRALLQLAIEHQQSHPLASKALKSSFYVDDCLVSTDSFDEAVAIQSQLVDVLQGAGFQLAKWTSSHVKLMPSSCEAASRGAINIGDSLSSALGLKWDPHFDCFKFISPISPSEECTTKRQMASAAASLFDPIGLIGPIIIVAKILLQEAHREQKGWDTTLSPELIKKWDGFVLTLDSIGDLMVPRWISSILNPVRTELHLFCDASQKAYGAAAYVVTSDSFGNRCSQLLTSKSRVAPIDPLTIPRLELSGARLAADLSCKLRKIYNPDDMYFWCDAMIILYWIHSSMENFKIFVAHRVKKILAVSHASQWRHVPTNMNPADIISRGATPRQLSESMLWWHGPSWLLESPDSWPPEFNKELSTFQDNTVLVNFTQEEEEEDEPSLLSMLLDRVSSLKKLQRYTVHWLRFFKSSSSIRSRIYGPISTEELETSLNVLIRMDQTEHFPGLAILLQRKGTVTRSKWKQLASLTPFVDSNGLIRVGGRLEQSEEPYHSKHPIVLPKSRLSELIIETEHLRQLHAGPSHLLAAIRQRYWPMGGRNAVKKIVHRCVRCRRANPRPLTQLMGQLPRHRVNFIRPFQSTGVDFAGPILYRSSATRGAIRGRGTGGLVKGYISVYVCMATKAVHLEFVTSLSTEAFLASFRRFAARRNTPRHMFSDCGRNFEGASRELIRLHQQQQMQQDVQSATADDGVIWHFNPPRAPHHGGLWESCVKGVKTYLAKVSHQTTLSYEEMSTVLCQIEAILNSRPICRLSTDPNETAFLTPGHFLTGVPGNALPDPNVLEIPVNRLSHWQLCQARAQQFGRKFRRLYLNTLQQKSRWRLEQPNIQPDEVVLVLDETQTDSKWIMGRVEGVNTGRDGRVRVVTVRTNRGTYVRPITKIARLFTEDPEALGSNQSMDQPEPTGEHV